MKKAICPIIGWVFVFSFLPTTVGQEKHVRMCGQGRRCEDEERERARPIESGVFSGLKVSLQSLLKQRPWEPINLSATAISIRRGRTLTFCLTHMHTHNTAFIHSYRVVSAVHHTLSSCALARTESPKTPCLMLCREVSALTQTACNLSSNNRHSCQHG